MAEETTFRRLFTIAEADKTIPLIRGKVARIKNALTRLRGELEQAARESNLPPWSPQVSEKLSEKGSATELVREVRQLIEEINSHGCIVNGPEAGLVDFPCLLGSEIVFLCWQLGEPRVGHWHRISDGFAGRRPLLDKEPGGGLVN